MTELTALQPEQHGHLRLRHTAAIEAVAKQHMLQLEVAELATAALDFPLFISKVTEKGTYAVSALTSFTPGVNLFAIQNRWDALIQPISMQTYPFFLMLAQGDEQEPVVGADVSSNAFSESEGDALFNGGELSFDLSRVKSQLIEGIELKHQTDEFLQALDQLGLIAALTISLHSEGAEPMRIAGLSTISEDRFNALSSDELTDLRGRGYLAPIFAILMSLGQLNSIIRRSNQYGPGGKITKISLEIAKDIQTF